MMNNIFNQFDPSSHILNPFPIPMITILLLMKIKITKISPLPLLMILKNNISKEMKTNMMKNHKKLNSPILHQTFLVVMTMNILSLNLYSWSNTSQPMLNLPLILILWSPILLFIMKNKKKSFLTHLIPQNTPTMLIPFLFLIETTSFFIRPMTLLMRLTANMIAGHIMILLCSNLMLMTNLMLTFPSLFLMIMTIMEMMMAMLQSYIIITLLSLYISEI